ncbi:PAR12 polymerase, partial [Herpetotheres cachinnans]|nr:PAR12 polymerase [Herpetotheres cachinnans]
TYIMFPSDWDPSALPEIGYEYLVEVSCDGSKYREIKNLFQQTMKDYSICRLRRTQSPALWQHFQLQKEHIEKRSPGQEVDERLLFHRMSPSSMPAICKQNFNWRTCGTHFTRFLTHGFFWSLGSYCARDASYSHQYCPSSTDHHSMLVAQIPVGDFVQGNQFYLRPPARPGISNKLLDSCVDIQKNPSIFVIFGKHHIYMAYILEYT